MPSKDFWNDQAAWSRSVFGQDWERGPLGPLKHLEKEVREALDAVGKEGFLEELVDIQFLLFDAARRAGYTHDEFTAACFAKLAKNKSRTWAKPERPDEPVEHDRSAD